MADRILIKDAIVLTQDAALGELPRADVLVEGDRIAAVGPDLSADGAKVIDADRRHRHPGLHRHPPPHLGDVDPDVRAGLRADHLLRRDPRQVRPALPARRRLRGEPVGRARVHQRGHHDARRLVAHHEHAGPRRRRRSEGLQDSGIRSVFAYGFGNTSLVDWWFGPDYTGSVLTSDGPTTRADPEAVLQLRRRADHDGPRDPRPELLQARGRPHDWELAKELGTSTSRSTSRWTGSATRRCRSRPARHGPALPEHDLHPRVALHRRGVGAGPRLGRQRLVRAADRGPDGPRLGAGREGDSYGLPIGLSSDVATTAPSDQFTQMHVDLRLRARAQAPGGVGRRPRRATADARPHHVAPGPLAGRRSTARRWPASPTGRARSRRARRPTS